MTTYPMPCNTRPAAAPIMGRVSGCPAACGRRCGGTILARQNLRLYGTRLQTKTRPNKGERPQRRLSTVSTVRNSLSTVKVWTLLFNADNDLRAFFLFVHTVHTFFHHGCEENPLTPLPGGWPNRPADGNYENHSHSTKGTPVGFPTEGEFGVERPLFPAPP
jgi:hypothetical protein